jgi:hypothetical protein
MSCVVSHVPEAAKAAASRSKTRANKESGDRMASTGHIGGDFTG